MTVPGPRVPRPLAVDAGLTLLVLGVLLAAVSAQLGGPGHRGADVLAVLVLAAIAGLTLLRRRAPALVLVATVLGLIGYHALSYPPVGLGLPLAVPLYSVAERGRWRLAALVTVAIYLFAYGYRWWEGQDPGYLFGVDLPTGVAVAAGAIALGDAARSRRRLRQEQERRIAAVRGEQREATLRQVQAERVRLAREVHDVLAHTVSIVSLHTDVVDESLADDPEQARRSVRAIREATDTALRDLRATVRALREPSDPAGDDATASVGGLAGLPELLDAARATGLRVDADVAVDGPLGAAVEGAVYRVVQESLTNVLRHAGARRVEVRVRVEDGEGGARLVHVDVVDDGRGPDGSSPATSTAATPVSGGHGIEGMRERVDLLEGRLDARGRSGGGFGVHARIPG